MPRRGKRQFSPALEKARASSPFDAYHPGSLTRPPRDPRRPVEENVSFPRLGGSLTTSSTRDAPRAFTFACGAGGRTFASMRLPGSLLRAACHRSDQFTVSIDSQWTAKIMLTKRLATIPGSVHPPGEHQKAAFTPRCAACHRSDQCSISIDSQWTAKIMLTKRLATIHRVAVGCLIFERHSCLEAINGYYFAT